jgi:predicted transcriptional regulator
MHSLGTHHEKTHGAHAHFCSQLTQNSITVHTITKKKNPKRHSTSYENEAKRNQKNQTKKIYLRFQPVCHDPNSYRHRKYKPDE